MARRARTRLLGTSVAALLLAATMAGCGDTEDDSNAAAQPETPGRPCGPEGSTDPANLGADREVARCAAGLPGPRPLSEQVTLRFATAVRAEFIAPLLLAESTGEFAKENLDVEIVKLPFADAVPQILAGQLDGTTGSLEASWFNAVHNDIDLRWVAGNFFPPDAGDAATPQTGLWVRRSLFSDPSNPDLSELKGRRLASNVGFTSATTYPLAEAFEGSGISLADLEIVTIPSADQVTALENEAADMAWLVDPFWLQVAQNDDFVLVATQPPGEPLGGFFFGPSMRGENSAVGTAFLRAIIRTINTSLAGDYQSDPDVVQQIADATESSPEAITGTPSLVFDWEIREGSTQREQEAFLALDRLEFDSAVPESELVDRSLYTDAVTGK